MLKKCSCCGNEKHGGSFKKTSKTPDGKYPYCKHCEWKYRVRTFHHRHQVALRLYRELVSLIPYQQPGKTHLYLNKDMFTKWLFMNPDFERLYKVYLDELGEREFHIKVLDTSKQLSFENLKVILNHELIEISGLFDPDVKDGD